MAHDHADPKPSAVPTQQVDNEQVRVTLWSFAPGAATGYHRHEMDYVIVPVTDGDLILVGPTGERTTAKLVQGQSYYRKAGVEHDVINGGSQPMAFVEVEMKPAG
jgi:quercetin dioxygenase-like cupin family protein